MSRYLVNTRIMHGNLTGVQRYLSELSDRFGADIDVAHPLKWTGGLKGHVWEQSVLPLLCGSRVLWSPSNSGPLSIRRQVVTLHDVVPLDHPEWLNPRFSAWYRFLIPKLVRRVSHIIADSKFTKERILHFVPGVESKVHVIHIGVDRRFKPTSSRRVANMRQELRIPSPYYLVAIGSLEPRKNIPRLIEAWRRIQGQIPDDIWLVIAGGHGKRMVFGEVKLDKLPSRVHLTGRVSDDILPALYSGAIAAPYLSVYEGFGLPPLESMACGTPPLTGDRTSVKEVVGNGGLMVNPFDVDAIADGILRLINDSALRARLRRNGLKRASSFTWERTATETWRVLEAAGQE